MRLWKILLVIVFQIVVLATGKSQSDTIKLSSDLIISRFNKLLELCYSPNPRPILSVGPGSGLVLSKMQLVDYSNPNLSLIGNSNSKLSLGYEFDFRIEANLSEMLDVSCQVQYMKENLVKE